MDNITEATYRLKFWLRIGMVTYVVALLSGFVYQLIALAIGGSHWSFQERLHNAIPLWVLLAVNLMLWRFAHIQIQRALERHPLAYLGSIHRVLHWAPVFEDEK